MRIKVLGTASIGGVPEWDCICPNCTRARMNQKQRRTRSSIAISVDRDKWILIDVGHDVKIQLENAGLIPREESAISYRESRLDSILLTHGHADHSVGLAEFCTGKSFELPVYGPPDLIDFLFGHGSKVNYFGELGRLARNYVVPHKLMEEEELTLLGEIKVKGFEVSHTQILEDGRRYPSTTFAYEISHRDKRVIYAPDIGRLNDEILERLRGVNIFFMDATFWWDDELDRISGIPVTSYQLGHVPTEESVRILRDVEIDRVLFTHFNHTNPVLDPHQPYRAIVKETGMELAYDGMEIRL
jgi:pyrroloquinoline quinone biosynthesis protein B